MTNINIQQICSITRQDKEENDSYEYKAPPKAVMWCDRSNNIGGFQNKLHLFRHNIELLSEQELINKLGNSVYVENDKVYYKPRLFFRMSNQSTYSKYFETVQELEDFLNQDILSNIKTITI